MSQTHSNTPQPKEVVPPPAAPAPGTRQKVWEARPWTRADYHRACNAQVFGPEERLELIAGEIIRKMSQNPPHAVCVSKGYRVLLRAFGEGYEVRAQLPLILAEDGEPEPDFLIVPGQAEDYLDFHPTQSETLLLVEISAATLAFDMGRKAAYYAEAGIADYWVVDIGARTLHVHREPRSDETVEWGFAYTVTPYNETQSVAPLAKPEASVPVADLLPPAETQVPQATQAKQEPV